MASFVSHRPNTFTWADLTTSDINAATSFYTHLFGWSCIDDPINDGMDPLNDIISIMFLKGDFDVCGTTEMGAEQRHQGIPSHWTSTLSVQNLSIEKICRKPIQHLKPEQW